MTDQISNIYALLIGIDCYMPNRLPDGSYYKNLGGCVRDINHVEAYLKDVRKIPETQIIKLTSSPSSADQNKPVENTDKLPTRSNIIQQFRELGKVPAGSQVYIHYSGHGGRAKTIFEDIKGAGEIDEGLVPVDIGTSEGQYLRDIELAHLLQELAKDRTVTAILDCCHSGGATRGDAEIRGMTVKDDKPLQGNQQLVASMADLRATWESLTGVGTRGLKAGGVPESDRYVVLAACRENEYAYEYAFNRETGERSGALTYWLLDTLRQPNPGQTYKDLYDRINPKIHSQFPAQTPLLLGAGDRLIFGTGRGETVFAVSVMMVETSEKGDLQAVIGAGQANGITKGAQFAIYPRGATNLTQKEERLAIATVIQRGASDSICKLEAIGGKRAVEAGDQAVQIGVAPSLVRKVNLFYKNEATAADLAPDKCLKPEVFAKQNEALEAIKIAIAEFGKGWVELDETVTEGENGEGIDFFVEINNDEKFEIRGSGGELFKNINPTLMIDDPTAPEKIVKRLVHLSKYRASIEIMNTDSDSPLSGTLSVKWLGTSDIYETGDPIPKDSQLKKFKDDTKPTSSAGEYIFLSIKNNSSIDLNVAVLNFEADWSVMQIHPADKSENFITLEAGKEEKIPLLLSVEGEEAMVENTIKVFATRGQANFRWLELPSLDKKIQSRGLKKGGDDPLENLLAAIDDEQPKTRKLTVALSPSREWTTEQLMLTITKS